VDYTQLDNLELEDNNKILQMLEDGIIMRRLQENEGFRLIDRVCRNIAENAKRKLLTIEAKPENIPTIIELQIIAKLYGDVLGNIKKSFIDVGNMAFEEGKLRGLIENPLNTVDETE
jgi:hypothetical protein